MKFDHRYNNGFFIDIATFFKIRGNEFILYHTSGFNGRIVDVMRCFRKQRTADHFLNIRILIRHFKFQSKYGHQQIVQSIMVCKMKHGNIDSKWIWASINNVLAI